MSETLSAEEIYERIHARAYEQYVLALVRGWGYQQETTSSSRLKFKDAWLNGEFPNTELRIIMWDGRIDKERVRSTDLWAEWAKDKKPPNDGAVRTAGDLLMLARGG